MQIALALLSPTPVASPVPPVPPSSNLLQENGDDVLQEDGSLILLEPGV